MRYVVSFFDRTTRRVSPEAARMFMQAQATGEPVFYKGNTYSGKSISSVRTIVGFFREKSQLVSEGGGFYCKYGHEHENRLDCTCKDAGFEKLLAPDELALLPQWDDAKEAEYALLPNQRHDLLSM